ncbi:MAG: hypothetical protein ACFE0O_07425 [Opitutales bacterium]
MILARKLVCFAGAATLLLFAAGCGGDRTYAESTTIPKTRNYLGIVKTTERSYDPVSPTTLDVHTDQLSGRENYSGRKVEFLWGLITVADY